MTRIPITLVLLALHALAGCGGEPVAAQDLVQALQTAIDDRDAAAYDRTLQEIDAARPLPAHALRLLAASYARELASETVWPRHACPTAAAIVRGAEDPVPWLLGRFRTLEASFGAGYYYAHDEDPHLPATPRLIELLTQRLSHPDAQVAVEGAWLLNELRREDREAAAAALIEATGHPSGKVSRQCTATLIDIGPSVAPLVAQAIRSHIPARMGSMARILSRLGPAAEVARPELESLLAHERWDTRMYAAEALIHVDRLHPQARAALVGVLMHEQPLTGRAVHRAIVERLALVELAPLLRSTLDRRDLDERIRALLEETLADLTKIASEQARK